MKVPINFRWMTDDELREMIRQARSELAARDRVRDSERSASQKDRIRLAVCPVCDAQPGEHCIEGGEERPKSHQERQWVAQGHPLGWRAPNAKVRR